MFRFLSAFLVLLVSNSIQAEKPVTNLPVWNSITIPKDSTMLFVAFQEAGFIREEIGDWLPRRLYRVEPGRNLFWSVANLTKTGERMEIRVIFRDESGTTRASLGWSWTLPLEVETVFARVSDSGALLITYPETGESREIVFVPVASVEEAKEQFSISKAAPLWSWRLTDL